MIGLFNVDRELANFLVADTVELTDRDREFPKLDGLFIDWVTTQDSKKPSKQFAHQAALVSYYTKKNIPVVIYDRFMCVSDKEYSWLRKFNVHFFEPALNNRRSTFEYLPHWIDTSKFDKLVDVEGERNIDVGFKGDRRNESFEKYYVEYMRVFPKRNVVYKDDFKWYNAKYTVAIDSQHNYNVGYLSSNIIDALSEGCMVLLPVEHRYYGNMFYLNVIEDLKWMDYHVKIIGEDGRMGAVGEIYNAINDRFPEFKIEHAARVINNVFKEDR